MYILFCYLFWCRARQVRLTQHEFRHSPGDTVSQKKIAIAKTAKYFWTTSEINLNWLTYRQCRFCLGLGKNIGLSI